MKYTLEWFVSGLPFLTRPGTLTEAVAAAVRETLGREPQLSTTGGTSDGRFIAPTGAQVVELGVINATIHKVNECVRVADIDSAERRRTSASWSCCSRDLSLSRLRERRASAGEGSGRRSIELPELAKADTRCKQAVDPCLSPSLERQTRALGTGTQIGRLHVRRLSGSSGGNESRQ